PVLQPVLHVGAQPVLQVGAQVSQQSLPRRNKPRSRFFIRWPQLSSQQESQQEPQLLAAPQPPPQQSPAMGAPMAAWPGAAAGAGPLAGPVVWPVAKAALTNKHATFTRNPPFGVWTRAQGRGWWTAIRPRQACQPAPVRLSFAYSGTTSPSPLPG